MKKICASPFICVLVAALFIFPGCTTRDRLIMPNVSAADKMAGLFNGTGKYLPGGINLGSTLACQSAPMDYQAKYQSGASSVNITKLTDSTVTISFLSGPYPVDKYSPVLIRESGNMISFGNLGFYDSNTGVLLVSGIAPNFSYSNIRACQVGIPFYNSLMAPSQYPRPDLVSYFTIKRYEFNGVKQ